MEVREGGREGQGRRKREGRRRDRGRERERDMYCINTCSLGLVKKRERGKVYRERTFKMYMFGPMYNV